MNTELNSNWTRNDFDKRRKSIFYISLNKKKIYEWIKLRNVPLIESYLMVDSFSLRNQIPDLMGNGIFLVSKVLISLLNILLYLVYFIPIFPTRFFCHIIIQSSVIKYSLNSFYKELLLCALIQCSKEKKYTFFLWNKLTKACLIAHYQFI